MIDISYLEMYPALKPQVGLRAQRTTFDQKELFRAVSAMGLIGLQKDGYVLLTQCDGQASLREILERYEHSSHDAILSTLQSELFTDLLDWHPVPQLEGFRPYQVMPSAEHRIELGNVLFHITNTCNFRCEHCYHNDYTPRDELSLEEIETLARQSSESQAFVYTLSGGEPFVHPKLMDIAHIFSRYYIPFQINTNGFIVTRDHLATLKDTMMITLAISIDGPDAEIHNQIRMNPYSWQKIENLLAMMAEENMPVRITSSLSRLWLEDLTKIDRFIDFLNQYQVIHWVLSAASPTGEAYREEYMSHLNFSAREKYELSMYILKRLQEKQPQNLKKVNISHTIEWVPGQESTIMPVGPTYRYQVGSEKNILCDIHRSMFMIEANGTVPFCSLFKSRFPMELGSIRQAHVQDLWRKLCDIRIGHAIPQRKYCMSCNLLKYCGGGCPGENPDPGEDILTACDTESKHFLPFLKDEYDKVLSFQQ